MNENSIDKCIMYFIYICISCIKEDFYENSIDKCEAIKVKIKRKSINYAINKANQRNKQEEICNDIIKQNISQELNQKAKTALNDIKNFKNEGIKVRSKNQALNKVYEQGKELNRKEEIKKWKLN